MFEYASELFRGVVVTSDKTTGEVLVNVPSVLGQHGAVPVEIINNVRYDGLYEVPDPGVQVVIGSEDRDLSHPFLLQADPGTVRKSPNWDGELTNGVITAPGTQGWVIDGLGSVEFHDGRFRGELEIGTTLDGQPILTPDDLPPPTDLSGVVHRADLYVTGTTNISGSRIRTGLIQSSNPPFLWDGTSTYSSQGMSIDLGNGDIITPAFRINGVTASFTGSIIGGTIDIGGADATSFHVDSFGQLWVGSPSFSTAPFKVDASGSLTVSGGAITGGVITGGTIRTASSGARVELSATTPGRINFILSNGVVAGVEGYASGVDAGIVLSTRVGNASFPNLTIIDGNAGNSAMFTLIDEVRTDGRFYAATGYRCPGGLGQGYVWDGDASTGLFSAAVSTLDLILGGERTFSVTQATQHLRYARSAGAWQRNFLWQSDGNVVVYNKDMGGMWSTGTGGVSDERLKKSVRPLTPGRGLEIIKQLRPVDYEWKDSTGYADDPFDPYTRGQRHIGLIAQEVGAVLPQAAGRMKVPAESRARKDGDLDTENVATLRKDELVPILVAAVKDLAAEVELIKRRLPGGPA